MRTSRSLAVAAWLLAGQSIGAALPDAREALYRGDYERAERLSRDAIATLPSAPAWYVLARSLTLRGRTSAAEDAYSRALELQPDYAAARLARALARLYTDDREASLAQMQQLVKELARVPDSIDSASAR